MKKLLYQFDTDEHPSVFDSVVCHDGGADHVIGYGGVHPHNVGAMVDGAIFTRAPKDKKNTPVILGGTGPVGTRAAVMLASEGATVTLVSRKIATAEEAAKQLKANFNLDVAVAEAADNDARGRAIEGANVVIATGAGGIQLLEERHWKDNPTLEMIADANATPPLGIEGIDMMDKGVVKHGKIVFGAIGFGALKIALQRACVGKVSQRNDAAHNANEICARAAAMAA